MSKENAQAYHIVAYEFAGRERAQEVMELIKKGGRANEYKVSAWAVVEVDDKGKAHVAQSGHGAHTCAGFARACRTARQQF